MLDDITATCSINGGYAFRGQLNAMGIADRHIRQACQQGLLTRIRHGTYALTGSWELADPAERLAVTTRSVLDKLGPGVVASHTSAAALHGLDLWGVDTTTVHVTQLGGRAGRSEAGVVLHQGSVVDSDIVMIDDRPVMGLVRTAVEVALLTTIEAGMVTVCAALRRTSCGNEVLEEQRRRFAHWPGAGKAMLTVRLSDGALETVGEVRSLHMMWRHSIPRPELQLTLDLGSLGMARVDFMWPLHRHAGEFDGKIKYGRLNPDPEEPGNVVFAEKLREDAIRELGHGFSRWTWADLASSRQADTAARLRRAMDTSRRHFDGHRRVIA